MKILNDELEIDLDELNNDQLYERAKTTGI